MTKPQEALLARIAGGEDPNAMAAVMREVGGRKGNDFTRTMMALYRQGYLKLRARIGGLEISDAGREAAARAARRMR